MSGDGGIGGGDVPTKSGLIASLADSAGVSAAAIRLLITIFAGYPIAAFYRIFVQNISSKALHHIFFALSGLGLCFFNYGFDTYHSLTAIWVTYILIRLLHNSPRHLVLVNFVFHMTYLLTGYYCTESAEYDILWTMPHCVLTLRMVGLVFDLTDGCKPRDKLSKDQLETALERLPSLLELFGFAYFPCSFLVGPQFPLRRYQRFVNGEFQQYKGSLNAGIKRMLLGLLYLAIRQVGSTMLPDSYFLSDAFRNTAFIWQLIYLGLWGKFSLYKYISCWLLTEGALMCLGFSYNGKTSSGEDDWSGCSNVKLLLLETGNTMQHYVHSFNVNTNSWVAQYVYKRLKFLNNRTISYGAALAFLALWHGFHSGYYVSFFNEYLIVTAEKQMEDVYNKAVMPVYGDVLNNSWLYKCLKDLLLKFYNIVYMGWCLTPFIFLSYTRWIQVQSAVKFFGFVYVGIWFVIYQIYKYSSHKAERGKMEHTFGRATELSPLIENEKKDN